MSELDDPRVLFAAERTLLAWSPQGYWVNLSVFTALAIAALGVALAADLIRA